MGVPLPTFMRNRFKEVLKKASFSAAQGLDLTRRVYTRTKDEAGRLTNISEADTTIHGFIQYVSPKDKQLLEQGWVQIGDAMLFVEYGVTVNEEDYIIDAEGTEWEVTKKVKAPKIHGTVIHQEFAMKRR